MKLEKVKKIVSILLLSCLEIFLYYIVFKTTYIDNIYKITTIFFIFVINTVLCLYIIFKEKT